MPPLVVLELTYRCGRECGVCFHQRQLDRETRSMPLELAQAVVRRAAAAGCRRLRLTGGEPLLHPGAFELLTLARQLGLAAWINTAGRLEAQTPWSELGRKADDILLPLREPEQRRAMADAVAAIRSAAPDPARTPRVRFGVVLTPERIDDLEDCFAQADHLDCGLEVYRVMSGPDRTRGSDGQEMERAIRVLDRLNVGRDRPHRVRVANALPFCLIPDRRLVARNAMGGRFDDGRSRLVVAPDGIVRPSYPMRLELGHVQSEPLATLWQHPSLTALHDPARLPPACQACEDLPVCRGGSRHEARQATGSYFGLDPLAIPSH